MYYSISDILAYATAILYNHFSDMKKKTLRNISTLLISCPLSEYFNHFYHHSVFPLQHYFNASSLLHHWLTADIVSLISYHVLHLSSNFSPFLYKRMLNSQGQSSEFTHFFSPLLSSRTCTTHIQVI